MQPCDFMEVHPAYMSLPLLACCVKPHSCSISQSLSVFTTPILGLCLYLLVVVCVHCMMAGRLYIVILLCGGVCRASKSLMMCMLALYGGLVGCCCSVTVVVAVVKWWQSRIVQNSFSLQSKKHNWLQRVETTNHSRHRVRAEQSA